MGTPSWVRAILRRPWLWHAARATLVSAFLVGGVTKLSDFQAAIAEQEHFGLRPGGVWAALAITVELGGSALVVIDRLVWFGAGGLGVLTAVAMLTANDFWNMAGHERFLGLNAFFEHLGLIAGLVLVAMRAAEPETAWPGKLVLPSSSRPPRSRL